MTKTTRDQGDPVRRAAAQARRAAVQAAREAADAAIFAAADDVRPADLPTAREANLLKSEALEALEAAQRAVTDAIRTVADAQAWQVDRQDLAAAAFSGNVEAQVRLGRQVRASHPGVVGFSPVPARTSNGSGSRGPFRDSVSNLGLVIDIPTTTSIVDDTYIAALAEAMRAFVRWYEPKIDTPQRRVDKPGYAYAETRVGRLLYHPRPDRPAFFQHAPNPGAPAVPDDGGLSDVTYPTLEKALAALPALLTVGILAGRHNRQFGTLDD